MPCSFVNLPREILCRIAYYLVKYTITDDLRQFRLTNKLCQSIAEIYLYEKFVLCSPSEPKYMASYVQLLSRPQRCKLVKCLEIRDSSLATLDDGFFELFSNIQTLDAGYNVSSTLSWKQLSEVFTSERCTLKRLPSLRTSESDIDGQCKMFDYHHRTLERLYVNGLSGNEEVMAPIIRYVNSTQWFFSNLRVIEAPLEGSSLQDFDAFIDKCPMLRVLHVSSMGKKCFQKWVPETQHQRPMIVVNVRAPCTGFFDVCNYFLAKFPNSECWTFSVLSIYEIKIDDFPIPLDEMIDFWKSNLLTKPDTQLNFFLECTALPHALAFFTDSYQPDIEITLSYASVNDYAQELDEERDSKLAMVEVTHYISRITKDMVTKISIKYLCVDFLHVDLFEAIGHNLRNLVLKMSDPTEDEDMDILTPAQKESLDGKAISHTLDHCSALTSLTISLPAWHFLGPTDTTHTNLEKMTVIVDGAIKESLLFKLSRRAPSIKDFTVEAPFDTYYDDDRKNITINMPQNNFDKLTVIDSKYITGDEIFDCILLQIFSSTQPVIQSCFKKHRTGGTIPPYYTFIEEEYDASIEPPFIEVIVICKSIKSFRLCGKEPFSSEEFFTKLIN